MIRIKYVLLSVLCFGILNSQAQNDITPPPGIVINHIPAKLDRFIGSPSICILPNGDYIASHDEFGPTSSEFKSAISRIYKSTDKGLSWKRISQIDGQFWSTLFSINDDLYIIGTNKHHGNVVLRKSSDQGLTWSIPYNPQNGLILEGEYHTAPTPVVVYEGRIWRTIEYATSTTTRWGERYSAAVISAPIDADLLNAEVWTRSNHLYFDSSYLNGNFKAWLEGNIVIDKKGDVKNFLRVHVPKGHAEMVAIVDVSRDGKKVSFDPKNFKEMPGSSKKFTIRYDSISQKYLSLVNYVPEKYKNEEPNKIRNNLALVSSTDLNEWKLEKIVLSHPDEVKHGFQYVDWLIEGNDIIFVSRTAFEDASGGAKNNHDANFLTFHRLKDFRELMSEKSY